MTAQTNNRTVGTTDVIIVGAGQSGLATSWYLQQRSIDHVILERGDVGNSWRRDRWDSMRTKTGTWPNRDTRRLDSRCRY